MSNIKYVKTAKPKSIKPNNRKNVVGIFFSFKHDDDSILTEKMGEKKTGLLRSLIITKS